MSLDEIEARIVELRDSTTPPISFSEIARIVSRESGRLVTKDSVQKVYRKRRTDLKVTNSTDKIRRFLKTHWLTQDSKCPSDPSTHRKILALGDLHGRPHPLFLKYIKEINPDIIVIGGDIFDQAQFSRHAPSVDDPELEMDTEIKTLRAWFEIILSTCNSKIYIMRGNHDDRFYKQAAELLPAHLLRWVKDPLNDVLFCDFPSDRLEIIRTETSMHRPGLTPELLGYTRYMFVIGDALLSHGNFGNAEKLWTWVMRWRRALGWPDFTLLAQFHTHQMIYNVIEGGNMVLVQPGMAGEAQIESYKIGYSSSWKPGTLGGVLFHQNLVDGQWMTDQPSVKLIIPQSEPLDQNCQ